MEAVAQLKDERLTSPQQSCHGYNEFFNQKLSTKTKAFAVQLLVSEKSQVS